MTILGIRTGTAALAAAAAAALAFGSPAGADVTVTPTQAVQGDAGRLTFRITNDNPRAAVVRIELQLPADNPIAEVYPLSVDLWAPRITSRPLEAALPGLHGGRVTDTTSAITWTPAPGAALKPGKAVDLSVALGPLPQTPTLDLTVVRTHSDGTVTRTAGRPGQPATGQPAAGQLRVTLAAPTAPAGAPGHGHATGPQAAPVAARPADPAPDRTAPAWWTIAGWVCAALAGCYALAVVRRGRRGNPAPQPVGGDTTAGQQHEQRPLAAAAAGTPVRSAEMGSRWTYRERG